MAKFVTVVLKILLVVGISGIVVAAVVSVGGFLWYRGLPEVEVSNQCDHAIVIPESVRVVEAIPAEISMGDSVTIPVVTGTGEYSLVESDGSLFVMLPNDLPLLGNSIRVGGASTEPNASFEGQMVTVPMQRQVENQSYSVVLCPN
jgi:hypothetical protein